MKEITLYDLRKYKKIYIIGAVGSGKTTLAHKLSHILNLPHIENDSIRWKTVNSTRIMCSDDESSTRLKKALSTDSWIIDGAQSAEWTEQLWRDCGVVIMRGTNLLKRILWITKRYVFKEEEKQKTSVKYLWKCIVWSVKFKFIAMKRFKVFSQKYNKPIFIYNVKL